MTKEKTKNITDKVALKAGGWNVFSSIMLKAIATLATPIFTRMMSTEDFGVVSTYSSWTSFFQIFCSLDLVCGIERAKYDFPGKLDNYIGSMQLLSLSVSMGIGGVLIVFADFFSNALALPRNVIILLSIQLLVSPSIDFYICGARFRYKYKTNIAIAWFSSVSTILLSLGFIIFINQNRAVLRILGEVIPTFVIGVIIVVSAKYKGNLKYNKEYWIHGLRLSVPLILHELSHNILSQSDRIFITKLCNVSDTGIYSIAYSYGCLMTVITGAVSNGWLPWFHDKFFAKEYEEINRNTKFMVMLGCYIGLACIALAPEAVTILGGAQYRRGVYCIAPVTLGIVCQYIYTHYINIEMHLKKTKFVPIGTTMAAILNLLLNAIFIPRYGFVAASYTTFVSYFVLMLVHYIYSRFVLGVKLYDDRFMFGAIAVTTLVAMLLIYTYDKAVLRYGLLCLGFASFIFVFRKFILDWFRRKKDRNR